MRLTTKSRYGTRMILDLAMHSENRHIPLNEISKRQNISLKYLEKLIRKLKAAGLVTSRRGPLGGHKLARPADEITVGDIVRTLEEGTAITDCSERDEKLCGICNQAGECLSQWVWIEASKAMFERLDQITISMLLDNRQTFIQDAREYTKKMEQS
ncbi:MAG: Rrf2 family transcriptional regulator [Desulfobacteraceae bacterium]|nr:Rrf2 family transcriptional regulator [Desulfobacteraceae bacterium]MBC2755293.1 Rrf2 family transcriptional regulator [Desulfobacteraceae bacterium]